MTSQLESNIRHCTKNNFLRVKQVNGDYLFLHASTVIVNSSLHVQKAEKEVSFCRSIFVKLFSRWSKNVELFFVEEKKMWNFLHYFATNLTQEHDLAWLCVTNPKSLDVCSQHFLLLKSNFTYI